MKKIALSSLLFLIALGAHAKGKNDTAYYRRPYYIGFNASYEGYVNGVFANYPNLGAASADPNSCGFNWATTYGLNFTLPFARHWELELGLEGKYVQGWMTRVTDVRVDPDRPWVVTGYDESTVHADASTMMSRIQLGYEVYRRNNYGFVVSGEMLVDLLGRSDLYIGGGYALLLKSYIPVSHGNGALVLSGLVGNIGADAMYVGMRVGFDLKGMRIYRHKPRKYYVQTYED